MWIRLRRGSRRSLAAVKPVQSFPSVPFHFDKVAESGITFVARGVEDTGRHYKAVHYDHGNGIAVADVDGDDLYDIYFVNQVGGNELWRNLGGGKFKNITDEAGVALRDRINCYCVLRGHRQ